MCKRSAVLLLLLMSVCVVVPVCAQSGADASASTVRYHFGDNPAWSSPSFDDSAWTAAQEGRWPEPAYDSDGYIWVRLRIPVRGDTAAPLAIRVVNPTNTLVADEVFVNGTSVGTIGKLPPHEWVNCLPQTMIFDVRPGVAQPQSVATIALRLWYPPFARRLHVLSTAAFGFDQRRTLHAEEDATRLRSLLGNLPGLALNSLICLFGLAVLLLGSGSRSRNLLLYGAMLATAPWVALFLELVQARILSLSVQEYFPLQVLSQIPAMIMSVVFIWDINNLPDVWLKRLAFAALSIFNIALIFAFMPSHSSMLATVAMSVMMIALKAFDVIDLAVLLWVLFVLRRNRLIAFAMGIPPVGSLTVGFRVLYQQGQTAFDVAFFFAGLFLSIALGLNAWKEWRKRDALRAEFEAARVVQQVLVPQENPPIAGLRIESVYKPAGEVGGDFYQILPTSAGGVLIVIGDVSGKGMPAAMTVSLLVGTVRTLAHYTQSPGEILSAMNQRMLGRSRNGFTTCLVLRVDRDGAITAANAGHLPPYIDGQEVPVETGLPLGLIAESKYSETNLPFANPAQLTLLTDGVVEAQSASKELFGFDRTATISTKTAEEIALAAQQFGQEDDITVLTLNFVPA